MLQRINNWPEINKNKNLENITFDTIKLKQLNGQQYENPVLTNKCLHLKECFELKEYEDQINNNQLFHCQFCNQIAQQYSDLMWDIRYHAYKEFHESVDEIHIIYGFMVNKYQRKKKYIDLYSKPGIKDHFLKLMKQRDYNAFLKSLIENNALQQQAFQLYCLLDFVKINIPIRIKGCLHFECYELTSLLYYQQNNQQNQNCFQCIYPECKIQLNISSLDAFFNGIFMDQELLKEIKKNSPTSIIFNIEQETKTIIQNTYFPFSQILTQYSNKYNQQFTEQQQQELKTRFHQTLLSITQSNLLIDKPELKQSLSQSTLSLSLQDKLVDQITKLQIELPTRCINCIDFNNQIDLLTYVFDFVYKKQIDNKQKYSCPLCNSSQNQIMAIDNLNKYIYIDQILLSKLIKQKNDQYQYECEIITSFNKISVSQISQLKNIIFGTFYLLNPQMQVRYRNPALTIQCLHRNICFEFTEAFYLIQQQKRYQCFYCNQQANSQNDLVQDWRVQAYKEFNEDVEDVTIIKGIMVNKYCRNKNRYLSFFTQSEYLNQFLQMFQRVEKDMQIVSLIRRDLQQQQNQNQNNKIIFQCFCLLDKVKINIPVRILGCKHYECYELTSLLHFQDQNREKMEYFECKQQGCPNRLRIAHRDYSKQSVPENSQKIDEQQKILDIQTLFLGICVDLDLLNAIKKSNPSSLKFYYNQQTQNIEEDINKIDGKFDLFIFKFYEQRQDIQTKMQYQEFQKIIQQQIISVSQGDLIQEDLKLRKQLHLYRYKNYKVNMKDKFTQLIIEYPVKCKLCTNLEVCMDIRSYIAHFNYQKKMFPAKGYSCPLCNQQLGQSIIKMNIQNYIYLDPNMLSYIYQDLSYTQNTNILEYHGDQYMLQEFMDRYKIKREDYIASLLERQVVFKKLFCIVNKEQRIKQPLILENCPNRNIVDFQSFYQELRKVNFDLEHQKLILCRCPYCMLNPITSIKGQIYFHGAFYEALNKYYQNYDNDQSQNSFTYRFADTERDSQIINDEINQKLIQVVEDLSQDQKFQRTFRRNMIQNYSLNFQKMQINIGIFSINLDYDGIYVDLVSAKNLINSILNLQQKEYHFQITKIDFELNNSIFGFISNNYRFSSDQ